MTELLLSRAHYPVTVLGPGTRAGIWTQGCTIHCSGCLSRDTWEADPGKAMPVDALLGWLASLPTPDGVTISGGEPFQQPDAVRELLNGIHAWRGDRPIDILVYSGYVYSWLRRRSWAQTLLRLCDAVIAGPYVAKRADNTVRHPMRPNLTWRGSANQRLVPLSPLGHERYAHLLDATNTDVNDEDAARIQLCVEDNRIYYIGIPRRGDMDRLTERLARAGIDPGEVSWRP